MAASAACSSDPDDPEDPGSPDDADDPDDPDDPDATASMATQVPRAIRKRLAGDGWRIGVKAVMLLVIKNHSHSYCQMKQGRGAGVPGRLEH